MGTFSTILGGLGAQSRPRRGVVEVLWPVSKFPTAEPKSKKRATDQEFAGATETKSARDVQQQDFALLDAIVAYPAHDVSLQLLDSLIKQDVPLAGVLQHKDVGFEILSSFYTVKDSLRVKHFLSFHAGLKKLLFAAFPRIKETWGAEVKTELEVFSDPEDDSVSLVVYITSARQDAYQLLDRFDEEWWLSVASSSDGLLTFAVQ